GQPAPPAERPRRDRAGAAGRTAPAPRRITGGRRGVRTSRSPGATAVEDDPLTGEGRVRIDEPLRFGPPARTGPGLGEDRDRLAVHGDLPGPLPGGERRQEVRVDDVTEHFEHAAALRDGPAQGA